MNKFYHWTLLLACVAIFGCEDTDVPPPAGTAAANPAPATPATAPAAQPATATPDQTGQPVASQPPVEREKAQAGLGKKGQGYGGGIITEPVRQYFIGQDRITFEIEIPKAMQLFQAEHNRFPKDMAEFQREILDPASIRLPDLYPGEKYVYDAQAHELMVERPAPANPAGGN